MKLRLQIAYDGTGYAGWQKQGAESADPRPTLQATLEDALSQVFSSPVRVQASGRTDAGVHAEAQTLHFVVPEDEQGNLKKDPFKMNLLRSLNALTPDSLTINRAWIAPEAFHANRSAVKKTYRYMIHNSPTPNALRTRYSLWVMRPLDVAKLNGYAEVLLGEHDFKSFQTGGTDIKTTVRRLYECRWTQKSADLLEFRVTGSGFLKQMIRNIVGTCLYLHQTGADPTEMKRILMACDRQSAKATARPEGLFLESVEYPPDLDNECREL
jgi:tRNA pseudouridine38-40 synthase